MHTVPSAGAPIPCARNAETLIPKWVSIRERNREKYDLPTVFSILIYTHPEIGFPLAICDGSVAAAVSAKWMARKIESDLRLSAPAIWPKAACHLQRGVQIGLDPAILRSARIFVDDIRQCRTDGEINIPLPKGLIREQDIAGEIGEVITGKKQGRRSDNEITLFDSPG